jgi:predicted  nucleic acid-binding Zn-ribbon protein
MKGHEAEAGGVTLQSWLRRMIVDHEAAMKTLSAVQIRCSELLEEKRALRRELDETKEKLAAAIVSHGLR